MILQDALINQVKRLPIVKEQTLHYNGSSRYFVELLAFGSMILLILYLIATHNGNLGMILPILSVYAIGSIKLLPAFQQIYSSVAIIRANIPAFEAIQEDLKNSFHENIKLPKES